MTSPNLPGSTPPDVEGRSVRDVVEYSPGQVDEAWCRKILRKILQSLELQYAMQMPHRAITPDTIVFHANGEPLLVSNDIDAAPAPDAQQADDLTALARVIHYAITQELAPTGPLAGRGYGYSAALIAAIDACMDPDPARRPRSVDAVRGLLGMVAPGTVAATQTVSASSLLRVASSTPAHSAAPPAFNPAPVARAIPDPVAGRQFDGTGAGSDVPVVAQHAGLRRGRRWAIAAGGGAIAIALALVLFPALRGAGSSDHIVPMLPQAGNGARPVPPAPAAAPVVGTAANDARADPAVSATGDAAGAAATLTAHVTGGGRASNLADSPASGASSGGATSSGGGVDAPDGMTGASPNPDSAADNLAVAAPPAVSTHAAVPSGAVSGNASYQLQIKPWGVVYVDGVDRGVSPPVKRLALTPGRHTIRITHPNYRDSILEFDSAQTTSNGKIIVDFEHEGQ